MNKLRHASLAGAAITVMMLTAACGGGGSSAKDDYGKAPAGSSSKIGEGYGAGGYGPGYGSGSGNSSQPQAKNAPAKEMTVREAPGIGSVVADGSGMTLYRFDKDTAQPPASMCDGDCAKAWPPVPAGDATASAGIGAAVGEVQRTDGTKQLTLAGWPVYRYAKDTAAGDTKGQGVGGTWSAFAPDGKKAGGGKQSAPQDGKQDSGAGAGAAAGVSVAGNPALGKIVVDGQGRTLYRFNKDSAWPMKFACTGTCLDTWKPAKPVDKSAVKGIPDKLISTVTRPDGTEQLAVDCWPVYWFTGDKKPGDTAGQGKQGLWFAVNDQGKKVTTAPSS
ncbi:SCO0930 family lipoprotein [Streptomyces sp. NPDC008001]|uniref:SCO0930 family lipoprotein n=1 Tax=Streptomyces sp. NPDC008001 TaxID=3364804 RepID=UPI0036E5F15A